MRATGGGWAFSVGPGQMSEVTDGLPGKWCVLPEKMTKNMEDSWLGWPCICSLSLRMEFRLSPDRGRVGLACKRPADLRAPLCLTNWMGLLYQISCQEAYQSNVDLLLISTEGCHDSDMVSLLLKDRVNGK